MPERMFDPERIRQAREEAGLTQKQLALKVKRKSGDTVRGYEDGRIEPPGHVVARIAQVTGRPRRWFVREDPEFLASSSPEGETSRAVSSFDPDEPATPAGLQRLIDMGVPLRADEIEDLKAYADPMNPSRGAQGAMNWSPGQWLDTLIEERHRAAGVSSERRRTSGT